MVEVAHKVAWAAVKQEYEKDEETGKWKRKLGKDRIAKVAERQNLPATRSDHSSLVD